MSCAAIDAAVAAKRRQLETLDAKLGEMKKIVSTINDQIEALVACRKSLILTAGVFTQKDAADVVKLLATGTDAQVQFSVTVPSLLDHEVVAIDL